MRRQSREAVFKYIYSRLFNENDEGLFEVLIKELNQDDKNFAKSLLKAVEKDSEKNLEIIEKLAVGYKLNRIFKWINVPYLSVWQNLIIFLKQIFQSL